MFSDPPEMTFALNKHTFQEGLIQIWHKGYWLKLMICGV